MTGHRGPGPARAPIPGHRSSRDGIALPIALAGIVLIGILAASGLYLAAQERRAGENAVLAEQALSAVDVGLGGVIEAWDGESAASLGLGEGWHVAPSVIGATASVDVTRLSERTFWVAAEGRSSRGAAFARRRASGVIRVAVPDLPVAAALSAAAPVTLGAGAAVSGLAGAPCEPGGDPATGAAGIAVPAVSDAGGDLSQVVGTPPVTEGTFPGRFAPGSPVHDRLASRASLLLADGAIPVATRPALDADGCDESVTSNWGEPRTDEAYAACRRYRRIVRAQGDLRLEGEHRGQGILLVDGNLTIPGRLEYRGAILVLGALDGPGELDVEGAVLVAGAAESWLGSGSVVHYGQCEIDRALTSAGHPRVARERGWADLF